MSLQSRKYVDLMFEETGLFASFNPGTALQVRVQLLEHQTVIQQTRSATSGGLTRFPENSCARGIFMKTKKFSARFPSYAKWHFDLM